LKTITKAKVEHLELFQDEIVYMDSWVLDEFDEKDSEHARRALKSCLVQLGKLKNGNSSKRRMK